MKFQPDKFQLRARIAENKTAKEQCVKLVMIVNGVELPFCFDVHKFLTSFEYSGRYNMLQLEGQSAIVTDIINSEENYWIWKNYFTQQPMIWHFERDKVLRQIKRVQTELKKLTEGKTDMRFLLGDTIDAVIAYKYTRPKLLWIDYLNKQLALKIQQIKTNGWKTCEEELAEIEYLLTEGAHIYKENRNGERLLDKIKEQPNTQLRELVFKIANYPLNASDESTATLLCNGEYKTFRAPKRMSLREAAERGFLVEDFK